MNLCPKSSIAGIVAGLILFVLAPSAAIAADKWDMPAGYSAKNYVTKGYIAFAEAVTKNSGGKLTVVVHPSGSLYKASEILRAVRSGQAPIGARYIGAHAKEDPIFGIDTVPFLATDGEEAMKLYRTSKPALEAALNKRGMKLLFTAIWPPQGLFTKKEIKSIADMKDVTFRAYDAMTVKLARLMGATPTKTEATEIGQAFSTGVAESMIASGAIGVFRKMWDYTSHFYEVNAWLPKSVVVANLDAWKKLDAATRKVVLAEAAKAEKAIWAAMIPTNENYKKIMTKNSMKVLTPSAELKAGLKKVGKTLGDEWAKAAGAAGQRVIGAYRQ